MKRGGARLTPLFWGLIGLFAGISAAFASIIVALVYLVLRQTVYTKQVAAARKEGVRTLSKRKFPIRDLVVLAIIVIGIACMIGPALVRARRSAQAAVCVSNLRQIGLSLSMYTMDYDEHYPNTLAELYAPGPGRYISLECLFCPGHYKGHPPEHVKTDEASVSYTLTPGLSASDDLHTVVARDKSAWNHAGPGMSVLFIDGHAEFIKVDKIVEKDFEKIAEGLTAFFTGKGKYPTNQEGLEILVSAKYLKNVPVDPFDRDGKRPYGYATKNVDNNWILTCYGPDEDGDINLELYAKGKLSTEDLLKVRTKLVLGMFTIKRSNGDIFRAGP